VKVIGALLLVSLLVALFTGTLGLVFESFHSGSTVAASLAKQDAEKEAVAFRTSMRESIWNRAVRRAAARHCYFRGMNQKEVLQALGEPKEKYTASWFYARPVLANAKCMQYSGVSRETPPAMPVSFTDGGYVDTGTFLPDECQTVNGDHIGNSVLFREEAAREKPPASLRAKTEAEARSWHTQKFCEANGFVWKDDGCHLLRPVNE